MKSTFKKQMFVQSKNPAPCSNFVSPSETQERSSFIDPATYMSNGEFVFQIPPEAPVFEPTVEEFLDPLAYINKIRPIAEKTGICKVKPPPEWHPPFAVDVDHFKFTPRIQKLNELDANTRVKLYFLDRLATYWNYTGVQIRIPAIDDKTVDMYSLYKVVELEGGFDKINTDKKWGRVANRLGYVNEKTVAPQLRQHYKRLLLPYEKFEKMKLVQETRVKKDELSETVSSTSPLKSESSGEVPDPPQITDSSATQPIKPNGVRRCTRSNCDENDTEILVSDTFKNPSMQDKNKELQRLTFYGPGPKILGSSKSKSNQQQQRPRSQINNRNSPNRKNNNGLTGSPTKKTADELIEKDEQNPDLLADSACMVCGKGDSEESILLCDGCDDGYHTFCLVPALTSIPKGEWRCPKCIAAVVSKATDTTFGFEQAEREYSLQQFGEMADQFKSNYFNMPVHMVPTEKVEQEYWKILASMDSSVSVEYGADLHSMDHGSGFPTEMALRQSGKENHYYKSYVESSWNLNNIPVLEGSVLGYINADISGMKIPWMYVGMCFSTFCWHNEDHWSYSINYLHWGEPKTWYGVPGFMAERFEEVMRETTPDLFRNQPDLLHQLVTILNPNILMDRGVPVYHIDQAAGEFVLTFPRAYHAGFNHGYNFAEAVNFAPVDWIPLGRECVEHYSSLHRYCVFSHDELICKMASVPENLNSKLASATHQDMLKMLDVENRQRKALLEWGVVEAEREAFELLADDERKCAECNTTCFLSAVTCRCSPKKVTCLRHFKEHCSCSPNKHTLRYRYTLDELPVMLDKLKEKADSVAAWAAKVNDALDINTPRTITLSGLRELLNEAREKHFPDDLSLNMLSKAIKSVQDALAVDFKNILSHKQTLSKRVTLNEIRCYYEELQRIPCVLPQENTVKHFLKFLDEFQENAERLMRNEKTTLAEVEALLKQGHFPNVEMPCIEALKNYKKTLQLIDDYATKRKTARVSLTAAVVDELLACSRSINNPNTRVMSLSEELRALKDEMSAWESKARPYLLNSHSSSSSSSTKSSLSEVEKLLKEADDIEACLTSREKLAAHLQKAASWKNRAENATSPRKSPPPFLEYVDRLLEEARNMRFELDESDTNASSCLSKLSSLVEKANQWKEEVRHLFLGECRAFGLMEVLMPRRSLQRVCKARDSVVADESVCVGDLIDATDVAVKDDVDVEKIVSWFRTAEKREFELMRALRVKNTYKKKQPGATYCVCNASSALTMRECTLCKDLFHDQCLKQLPNYCCYSEDGGGGGGGGVGGGGTTGRNNKNSRIFLCPFCQRSRRPTSKSVLNALSKFQKLRIRSLESVAMQCLLDRETKWKEAVDELLKTPELAAITRNSAPSDGKTKNGKFSQENRNNLESLLFRGFLLELDLPENEIIHKILHKLDAVGMTAAALSAQGFAAATNGGSNSPSSKCFDLSKVDIELSNETCSLKNELTASHKKRKWPDSKASATISPSKITRHGDSPNEQSSPIKGSGGGNVAAAAAATGGPGSGCCVTRRSRTAPLKTDTNNARSTRDRNKGGHKNNALQKYQPIESPGNEYRSKTSSSATAKVVAPYEFEIIDENDEVEEEEQTECDARSCSKPSGEHVDWVQCDYCKNWLHMICIGVTKHEVDCQTEFMCSLCRSADESKLSDNDGNDNDDDVVIVDYASNNTALCSS